jgi:serine protease Do
MVQVKRGGVARNFTIKSGLRPDQASLVAPTGQAAPEPKATPGALGLELAPDPKGGLVVKGVDPKSDAAAKGLHPGDVILKAGAHELASAGDLADATAQAKAAGRKSVPLLVLRGGQRIYVPIDLAPPAA